jgi:DNA-binding PadR family transcriptional regulator
VQSRNLKSLLAQLALIAQTRALSESIKSKSQIIASESKQQANLLQQVSALAEENSAELEAENARVREENARLREQRAADQPAPRAEGSSPLRNDVRLVRPELAVKLGLPAALVLQQLSFLLGTGIGRIIDCHPYITLTSKEWANRYFPFYSEWTVERAFKLLEKEELVTSKQADGRDSRVKSYRISPEGSILLRQRQEKAAGCGDATRQNAARKEAHCALPSSAESESSTTPTAAGRQIKETDTEWLARLASKHGFDVRIEWPLYIKKCKKWGTLPTRTMFEKSWIPNIQPAAQPKIKNTSEIEPAGFSNWFVATYSDQERPSWSEAPQWMKDEFKRAHKVRSTSADSV